MIPEFNANGLLPKGVHNGPWKEFAERFGTNAHRKRLLAGLGMALVSFSNAGCQTIYLDGSFVTAKQFPGDYDCCWDAMGVELARLDPVFFDFRNKRAAQKAKYGGEFFPAHGRASIAGRTYLEFFQIDKETGYDKGIVVMGLERHNL